ncbi:MAG: hypothetical protein PWQ76_1115 [Clostridiales bacterium]|nr:hypothetical protein [Oscillospiraceae bacterium]MDN5378860.1 hypothetical protein [Clostridiales bacterium]
MQKNLMTKRINTKHMVLLGIYTAIALAVFAIEAQLPPIVPVPGIKLGLANITTLLLISEYAKRDAFVVLVLRIVLGSIFSGQAMSFFYSLAGGLLCFAAMSVASLALKNENLWFTSIIGGIFHNLGQILIAMFVLKSENVLFYLPVLIAGGIAAGLFTGLSAQFLILKASRIKLFKNKNF